MTAGSSTGLIVTTPREREIHIERVFNAPRELVFDAWTNCEHLKRWYGPRDWTLVHCEIDLRPGGRWRFVQRGPEGMEMGQNGEYQEVVRPECFVTTEVFEGPEFEQMGAGTVNTLAFEEQDGRTTLKGVIAYASQEARDAALQTPMEEGMGESFDRLAELVEARA